MSKKLFVILGVLLLVVLSYGVSLAERPLQKLAVHPDQKPLLRPDVRLQGHPWVEDYLRPLPGDQQGHPWQEDCIRPLPGGQQIHPEQEPLLRPDAKIEVVLWHPWEEDR